MGKFKVGDRVAVYGHTRRTPYSCDLPTRYMRGSKGEVSCVLNHDELMIQFDDGSETEVHPKQCRRLVKKERKRVWIQTEGAMCTVGERLQEKVFFDPKPGCLEFVEVRCKRGGAK